MITEETVPCKWCSAQTSAIALKECPDCWEMRSRIFRRPYTAAMILAAALKEKEGKCQDQNEKE